MTKTEQIKIREEWKSLNVKINQQMKRAGKTLPEMPDSEWKTWMYQLIEYRDTLTKKIN